MKTLRVADVRNHLPAVIDEVVRSNEPIIVSRYGKPVVTIVPFTAGQTMETRYPLRGQKISVANDFDEPTPDLWQALSVAEEHSEYAAGKSKAPTRAGTPKSTRRKGAKR